MIGDGGQSGFDVAIPEFRFHNFTNVTTDVNFNNGNIADWIWISDPVAHGGEFYAPVISDPVVSKSLFGGTSRTAYRTQTAGLGTMTVAEANQHCNEWTGDFTVQCGDWAELGPNRLPAPFWGDRAGGNVAAIERTAADTGTAWAATTTGRVFVTKNVDAPGVTVGSGGNPIRVATNVALAPHRPGDDAEPVRQQHPRRLDEREPGVGLVHRLQRQHACDAGPRVRGRLQPGHGHGDVDNLVTTSRPADHGSRP